MKRTLILFSDYAFFKENGDDQEANLEESFSFVDEILQVTSGFSIEKIYPEL